MGKGEAAEMLKPVSGGDAGASEAMEGGDGFALQEVEGRGFECKRQEVQQLQGLVPLAYTMVTTVDWMGTVLGLLSVRLT